MTDFVDRLLGRSDLPPIRPLLPTLFEPARRGDGDEQLPMGVFTNSPAAGTTAEPVAPQGFVPREPPPLSPPTPKSSGTPLPAPLAAPNRDEAVPAPDRPHGVRAETDLTDREPAQHRHPVAARAHHRVVAAQPDLPNPPTIPSTSPTPPAPQLDLPSAQPVPAATRRHSAEPPGASPHAVVRSRDRAQEPDVHISIGRVEIKATPEATQQEAVPQRPKEAPRRPQLTLDDYLKSRES